jgi:hypothetical protein
MPTSTTKAKHVTIPWHGSVRGAPPWAIDLVALVCRSKTAPPERLLSESPESQPLLTRCVDRKTKKPPDFSLDKPALTSSLPQLPLTVHSVPSPVVLESLLFLPPPCSFYNASRYRSSYSQRKAQQTPFLAHEPPLCHPRGLYLRF